MWTNKNHFFIMSIRVNKVRVPIAALPIRCVCEVLEGALDILYLFRFISKPAIVWAELIQNFLTEFQYHEQFDLVDIDVKNKTDKFKMKIMMR